MNGVALQSVFGARIQSAGQLLTVTRNPDTQGGAVTTRRVYFLPQPLNATGAGPLQMEAGLNVGEDNPYDFVCVGGSDVMENDRITFDGFNWRVTNANAQRLGGVAVSLHCYAVREGVGS